MMQVIEFKNYAVSMFQSQLEDQMTKQDNTDNPIDPVSLFDVKDLYDYAYGILEMDTETSAHAFKEALAQAVKLDMQYRRQLMSKTMHKNSSKQFSPALEKHTAIKAAKERIA
jgi:hypothetical protein